MNTYASSSDHYDSICSCGHRGSVSHPSRRSWPDVSGVRRAARLRWRRERGVSEAEMRLLAEIVQVRWTVREFCTMHGPPDSYPIWIFVDCSGHLARCGLA